MSFHEQGQWAICEHTGHHQEPKVDNQVEGKLFRASLLWCPHSLPPLQTFIISLPPLTGNSPSGILGPSQVFKNPQGFPECCTFSKLQPDYRPITNKLLFPEKSFSVCFVETTCEGLTQKGRLFDLWLYRTGKSSPAQFPMAVSGQLQPHCCLSSLLQPSVQMTCVGGAGTWVLCAAAAQPFCSQSEVTEKASVFAGQISLCEGGTCGLHPLGVGQERWSLCLGMPLWA